MKKKYHTILAISLILLLCLSVAVVLIINNSKDDITQNIRNYEECVAAGGAVRESYPAVCVLEDGTEFVQPVDPDSIPR
ncbi:MAG TPA: hypothetical protein PKC05_03935 [Candidatus Saccharibacteria bacterium]|nr:hypothetical protein [Candidatus Saccharibacteria bacterium]